MTNRAIEQNWILTGALAAAMMLTGAGFATKAAAQTEETDATAEEAMTGEMGPDAMAEQDTKMPETEPMADTDIDLSDADMTATMDEPLTASASFMDPEGNEIGTAELTQTPNGVLIVADLTALSPGEHGFHIHETGSCAPDFTAAGGHYAPRGNDHGAMAENGLHAGDMPNIHVGDDGAVMVEVLNANISLEDGVTGTLFDEDGSALMIHSGADDYTSQPSGDAGDRVACAVIDAD